MLFLVAALISIHSNFEGGSLGKVDVIGPDHYRCHVRGQTDQDGRNRQASWYYFRVDDAAGKTLTFDMTDLAGEYNYQPTRGSITKDTLPFYSSDNVLWHPVQEAAYDTKKLELRFSVRVTSDRLWIAHVPPYTTQNFRDLVRDISGNPNVKVETIGRSVESRPIPLVTITDAAVPDTEKKVVCLMFRQHAGRRVAPGRPMDSCALLHHRSRLRDAYVVR